MLSHFHDSNEIFFLLVFSQSALKGSYHLNPKHYDMEIVAA